MEVTSYNSFVYDFINDDTFTDFVYHTDINWESSGGLAGCGLVFHSDGDINEGQYYIFALMRLQNAPLWEMYYVNNGGWKSLGHNYSNAIKDKQGEQNELVIITRGANVQAYVNGTRLTEIDYNKLTKGAIAEMVWQDSGVTSCTFSDTWVWALK